MVGFHQNYSIWFLKVHYWFRKVHHLKSDKICQRFSIVYSDERSLDMPISSRKYYYKLIPKFESKKKL